MEHAAAAIEAWPAWVNLAVTVCGLFVTAGVSAVTVAARVSWSLSEKMTAMQAAVMAKIDELEREESSKRAEIYVRLEALRTENERKIEKMERNVGETITALRTKVTELEISFIRRNELRELLDDRIGPIMSNLRDSAARMGRIEAKLFGLPPPAGQS